MGLFNFFSREKRAADEVQADDVLLRAIVSTGQINEEQALAIPAFAKCVDFVADTVAALPIKLYRDCAVHQTAEEITEDKRLELLNSEGGDLLTAYDARRAQIRDMLIFGAGYMFVERAQNKVRSLRYVKQNAVSASTNFDPIFKDAEIRVNGRVYYPWDFVVITRNSCDGVTGRGMLRQIDKLLSTAYNEMIYESMIAKTGGNKKGFLQAEKKLSRAAIDEMRAAWNDMYTNNNSNMMVLNDGVKFAQSASTSVEMQLNDHKRTNAEMIAQSFGLSTAVISGSAGTAEYMSAIKTAVMPVVEEYQAALDRALLLESEKQAGYYFVLDAGELLKGDMVSRFNAYSTALQNNIMSIDEVRYRENLPPLDFNYMKLGLADVLYNPHTGQLITPNTGLMQDANACLTKQAQGGIIEEERARHWIKGEHGYFAGSYSDGKSGANGLTKGGGGGIMNVGSGVVTIKSIDSPIEQQHTGKGNPNAILTFDTALNNRQQELLDSLPEYDSRVTVPRESVNMTDLAALTAKTGDEFAMFTKSNERLIIRGNSTMVNISVEQAKELAEKGYRWSGHTHPGIDLFCLEASKGDWLVFECFDQTSMVIYNSKGQYRRFEKE